MTRKPDLLINFCPRCGHKNEESVINSLGNGGDWECEKCECYVEAYVLQESNYRHRD